MKTIRIYYIGFWWAFDEENNWLTRTLRKHYQVQIMKSPEEADYLICGVHGLQYRYIKYDKIRIMISGEPYIPDFNVIDYGISTHPIQFLDRYFSIQCGIEALMRNIGHYEALLSKERSYTQQTLADKEYFASFIASHESEGSIRGDFFKLLSEYRRVESCGSYLNNQPGGNKVSFRNESKIEFQRKCKFSLCFESTKQEGFITEKIEDAFLADTIPIYFGEEYIKTVYNPKAFIYVGKREDFQKAIDRIIELDQDDQKYLEMLNEPIYLNPQALREQFEQLERYICYIFDQPLETAWRRVRYDYPTQHNDFLKAFVEREDRKHDSLLFLSTEYGIGDMLKAVGMKIRRKLGV